MYWRFLALFVLISAPAVAQQAPIDKVYACADISDANVRHTCFDALVPELKKARSGSFSIPTTPTVRLQQQAELGLSKPPPSALTAPVTQPGDSALKAIDRISLPVKTIMTGPDGKTRFTMENGQIWKQVDSARLRNIGDGPWTADIRKAAFGSYLLTIGKSAAIRVERQN